jgi:hypothetical protein
MGSSLGQCLPACRVPAHRIGGRVVGWWGLDASILLEAFRYR